MDTVMRRRENPFQKLEMAWQRSTVGSSLIKINRARKSIGKRPKRVSSQANRISLPSIKLPKFLSFIKLPKIDLRKGILFRVSVIAIFIVLLSIVIRISSVNLSLSQYANSDTGTVRITGDTINILVIMYDKPENYPFVDVIGVLSINKREEQNNISFVNIDPDFSTDIFKKKQTKLRSMLATVEADQETGVEYLTTAVQNMLAIRIDRYLMVDKKKLANFFLDNKVNYTTTDSVSDAEAGNFTAGKQIMGSEIIKYLAADSAGNEAKGARIGKFLQNIIPRYLSLGGMLTSYLNLENAGALFETNMQKQEIWELAINLLNRGSVQYAYISTQQYGRLVESRFGGYYSPDILTIDAKVQTLLTRSRVAREQGRIEIFNATKTAGLATAAKRQLTNQGANIIRAGNSPELSERSKLYVEDVERFSANISLIREILRDDILLIEEPYPLNHTGDMVLILGGSEGD